MVSMRTVLRFLILSLLGSCLLSSCGLLKRKSKGDAVKGNPDFRLSGRIQQVNQDAQFVLIRRYGPWKVGKDQIVESRGDGRTANLLPTGEELGEHIAADIRSGNVEVGDAVYIRKISKTTKEDEVFTTPEVPSPAKVTPVEPVPVPNILPEPPKPAPVVLPTVPVPEIPEEEPEDQL